MRGLSPFRTECVAGGRSTASSPHGFTLIEILIVVLILGILAAIVLPQYQGMDKEARVKTTAANARKIRELIQIHRHSGDFPLNPAGFPVQITAAWFRGNRIAVHAWTRQSYVIEHATAGSADIYPAVKTFDLNDPLATNAWYNTDNGRFIVRIPPQGSDPETLALFNEANVTEAQGLGDTQ